MFAIAMATLLQGSAAPSQDSAAQAQPPKPAVVTNPDWARRPDGQDIARYYPKAAMMKNLGGRAVLSCKVRADGSLDLCTAHEESPAGEGFGEAVLSMAPLFKMRPVTKDGQPVDGGTVRIPIRFVLPGGSIDALTVVANCYGETSAKTEKTPDDEEAWKAYGFFASQLALRSAQAKTSPTAFELALLRSRTSATKGRNEFGPTLGQCLTVYRQVSASPAPAPAPP